MEVYHEDESSFFFLSFESIIRPGDYFYFFVFLFISYLYVFFDVAFFDVFRCGLYFNFLRIVPSRVKMDNTHL